MKTRRFVGIFLCLIVTTIFSFHYIVAKTILTAGVSQFALSSWRGLLGGGLLLIIFRKKLSLKVIKDNWLSLFFISFLGFFINQILFMKGLSLTSSLNVAVISNTIPIITAVFAFLVGIEKITIRKAIGIFITFSLVSYLIMGKHDNGPGNNIFNFGNSLILLNVIAFCFAFVLGKKLLKADFPYELLAGLMLFGGGVMMIFVAQEKMMDIYQYSSEGVLNFSRVVFEILVSTSVVYLLNIKALQLMNATKVSFFIYLQPIITGVSDFVINGNAPRMELYFVFAGILVGGYLVVLQRTE